MLDQLDQLSHTDGMGTRQVNVYEAKAQLSKLIESVMNGDDVIIARAGTPAVRLVKWQPERKRILGLWQGKVRIADDFDEFNMQDEQDWYGS